MNGRAGSPGRVLGWGVVALLLALLGASALDFASGAPEHVSWRHIWREAPLAFWPAQWADFPGQPNLLTFRALDLALVHWLGVGFERLWLAPVLVVVACVVGLARLARHTLPGGAGPWSCAALVMLLLSPAFGANWLIAERFRVVLPLAWFLLAVACLRAGIAVRRRVFGAGVCAALALTTHDAGAVVWVALLPLVGRAAARGGRRPWAWIAGWALCFNLLSMQVWDEVTYPMGGLGAHLVERPLELGGFLLRVVALVLPEPLPVALEGWGQVGIVLGALAWLGLAWVSLVAWRARTDQPRLDRATPWLACAWLGALAALAHAHRHFPLWLPDHYVREIVWAVSLLPLGVAAAAAALWPEWGGRVRGPAVAVFVVLAAQQWAVGIPSMAVKGRVLRQSDAALALAELDGLLAAAVGPVTARADRDYLHGLGVLPRAVRLDQAALLALPRASAAGAMQSIEGVHARGSVESRPDFTADLVVLVGTRADGSARVVATVAPAVNARFGTESFDADLGSLAGFVTDDVLSAVAFDGRQRRLAPLAGRWRMREGGFVAEGDGR